MRQFKENGDQQIEFVEGKYAGIIFKLGEVKFLENIENDDANMQFEYDLITVKEALPPEFIKEEFEHELGDFLIELIEVGIATNTTVYTGGSD